MSEIPLEQHWYGSAPTGLQLSRGFQVIARSAGLGDDPLLEGHCVYKRPPSLPDKKAPPVNWGWFDLGGGRVCIHRVGYAGTDELGRPGNFLAHNLIARTDDLKPIDYDVPALIRWMHGQAQPRYALKTGGDDGFARNYKNLYEVHGEDKGKLGRIGPLSAPVQEVLALRRQLDDNWERELLTPLRQRLKPEGLTALLHAYLCEADQRRPILLVVGGDEDGDFSLEFKVADFLFSLMPFHCRSGLSFSTYSHDPNTLLAPAAASDAPAPHKNLRLVMTTPTNDFAAAAGRAGSAWVVNAHTGRHAVPPPSRLSTIYDRWVREGCWSDLRQLRDRTHPFAFAQELPGLRDAYALRDFAIKSLSREDYGAFIRAAACMRTTADYPEFLAAAHHAIAGWRQVEGRDSDLLRSLTEGYLRVLRLQYERLGDTDRAARRTEVSADLGLLFREALVPDSTALIGQLLRVVNAPRFADLRPSALEDFAAALEDGVRSRLGPHPARAITAARLGHWADLWEHIREGCRDAERPCQNFLGRVSALFCALLCQADASARRTLRTAVQTFVLPMLCSTPVPDLAELERRLSLLWDVHPAEGPASCADLLMDLARAGQLRPPLLTGLAEERRDLVLRFFEGWRGAMKEPALQAALQPLLNTKLIADYWRAPLAMRDTRLHHGLRALLRVVRRPGSDPQRLADRATKTGQQYLAEGGDLLGQALRPDSPPRSAEECAELAAAHCDLLELLGASEGTERDKLLERLRAHLLDLLAWMLAVPGSALDGDGAANPLAAPVELFVKWYAKCGARMHCYRDILGKVIEARRQRGVVAGDQPALLGSLREALAGRLADPAEAVWLPHALRLAADQPGTPPADLEVPTLARVLEDDPSLADNDEKTRPMRTCCAESLASGRLWQCLADRLIDSCADHENGTEAFEAWFASKGRRRSLVDGLQRRGLLADAGEKLTSRLVRKDSGEAALESIRRLNELYACSPPAEVAAPARRALADLLPLYLNAIHRRVQQSETIPGWVPGSSAAVTALTLCRPLLAVGDAIEPGWLHFFWSYLGTCLCSLSPAQMGEHFPEVFQLGLRLGGLGQEPEAIWVELFGPLAQPNQWEKFADCFLAAGDSLFVYRHGRLNWVDGVEHLANLRHAEELAACFWREAPGKKGILGVRRRPDREDVLLPAVGRLPEAACVAPLTASGALALVARALFAAALYVPEEMAALATVYWNLGFAGETWQAHLSALALTGYVLLEGNDAADVSRRLEELLGSAFLKTYGRLCGDDRRAVCEPFGQGLTRFGVEESAADKIARRLRKKL